MKLLKIDFNAVQKAMEDVARDRFDYFLDLETGKVITISQVMLERAEAAFYKNGEFSEDAATEDFEMPAEVEAEVETAVRIFSSEKGRYVRIPERESSGAFSLMKKFIDGIEELKPHDRLSEAINGPNSFGSFKKALAGFPGYRERWFAYNAHSMKKTISEWLESIEIKPEQGYY